MTNKKNDNNAISNNTEIDTNSKKYKISSRSLIFYILIIVIVVIAFYIYLNMRVSNSYDVSITLKPIYYNTSNSLYPFSKIGISMNVKNLGSSNMHKIPLDVYLNNNTIKTYTVSLPAHKTVNLTFNYTFAQNGSYYFEGIIDPASLFNITDKKNASSGFNLNVSPVESPDLYVSIPNKGINGTYEYDLSPKGIGFSSVMSSNYNLTTFKNLFGSTNGLISNTVTYFALVTNITNGVYAKYNNGSAISNLWILGNLTTPEINSELGIEGYKGNEFNFDGLTGDYFKYNNSTSICTYYNFGWNKIVSVYNNSLPFNCKNIISKNYTPDEFTDIVNSLKSNPNVVKYEGGFIYSNYSSLGQITFLNKTNLGYDNLFENGYGVFSSQVLDNLKPVNISTYNGICYGGVYRNITTGVDVCSTLINPVYQKKYFTNYSLVNSTELGSNYSLNLYSFTKSYYENASAVNGDNLINALNISQNVYKWKPSVQSNCSISTKNLSCGFVGFDYATDIVALNITNNLNKTVLLNNGSCYVPGMKKYTPINTTLIPKSSNSILLECYNIPIPIHTTRTDYNLTINYTLNKQNYTATGNADIATDEIV